MAIASGTRLGAYEIGALIGSGGMGEVYRARDVTLGRDVAVKILPSSFTADPERLARFRREAQVLASLNHANIAQVYGLDDSGTIAFLVLELAGGESLDKRLARGSIRCGEALAIVAQIAAALEAAHDKGIIHRDLKPANVALALDGQVKLLDFGLAKAIDAPGGSAAAVESPTITAPAMLTLPGVILGTAAYMAPEQAKGLAADKRADIWAFGCVLYEMLAGRPAFRGDSATEVIAAVLERDVDWAGLPASTPPRVRWVLRRCLEKNPQRRWRDIADLRAVLEDAVLDSSAAAAPPRRILRSAGVAWAVCATAMVAATMALLTRSAAQPSALQFEATVPPSQPSNFVQLAISPDGHDLVVAPAFEGRTPLWERPLSSATGRFLRGTEGAIFPFWSPDGRFVGFFADHKLKRVSLDSESVATSGVPAT